MNFSLLLSLLLKIAAYEWPTVMEDKPRNVAYRDGVATMATQYAQVGSEGALISPEADPLMLAVIGWEESRHRPGVRDGDCGVVGPCNAVGPMQLSRSMPSFLAKIDEKLAGLKVNDLRDPDTAVRASYRLLRFWKEQCPGSPAHWLGAWAAGRCFKSPIELGVRRCVLAKGMADAAGVTFPDCPARKLRERRTLKIVARLKEQDKVEPAK